MSNKIIHLNIPDFKENGLWVKYTSTTTESGQILGTTNSRRLYNNLRARCNRNSIYVNKFPTYQECTLDFNTFQDFAEWCNSTQGYGIIDTNNRPWCLDKDLLVIGNKSYSPSTCCFIPEYVNNSLICRGNARGLYPLGVTKISGRSKRYAARCQTFMGRVHLGSFETPSHAHSAWQKAKVSHLQEVAAKYKQEPFGFRQDVYDAIIFRAKLICQDLKVGRETLSV